VALRSRNLDLVEQVFRRHAFASVELLLGDLNARPRAAATSSAAVWMLTGKDSFQLVGSIARCQR
jgi:endonuclease/exonuclease/phosphatase (EEP) superfamily protein YafD